MIFLFNWGESFSVPAMNFQWLSFQLGPRQMGPCGLSNRLRWTMDSVFGMPLAVHKFAVLRLRTADRLDLSEDVVFPWNSNGCNGCFFHLTKRCFLTCFGCM